MSPEYDAQSGDESPTSLHYVSGEIETGNTSGRFPLTRP